MYQNTVHFNNVYDFLRQSIQLTIPFFQTKMNFLFLDLNLHGDALT